MKRLLLLIFLLTPLTAVSSHHGWRIVEVFSNADGTLQFIEMFTSGSGESNMRADRVYALNKTTNVEQTYTFPQDLYTGATAGRSLLLATSGFEATYGIKPDYIIPDGFLTTTSGDVWYNAALAWNSLPTDGVTSYQTGGATGTGTPKNFGGETVTLKLPDTVKPTIGNVPAAQLVITSDAAVTKDDSRVTEYFDVVTCSDDTDSSPTLNIALPDSFASGSTTAVAITCTDDARNTAETSADVMVKPEGKSATQFLMTTSSSKNVTTLHVVNTATSAQSFTGNLYNEAGEQLGGKDVALHTGEIAAKAKLRLTATDIETLFGVDAWTGPAMLRVYGTDDFVLMAKLVSPSGLVSNTNCVRETRVLNIEPQASADRFFVRFINIGDTTITDIKGTLHNTAGAVIGSADQTFVASLAPKQATWKNAAEIEAIVGASWEGEALLEVPETENLKLLNLNLVNSETFFNFSCFESADSASVFLMTTSTSKNISLLHLVNTSDTTAQFKGTLYNGDGEQLGASGVALHDGSLASNARVILSAADLETRFGVTPWSGPAYLVVTGPAVFDLMIKLQSPSGLVSNTNCVRSDEVHNIEPPGSSDKTFVRFINTGTTEISGIKGTLYDRNGNQVGSADAEVIATLAPKQATWKSRDELASIFGVSTWEGEASLAVTGPDSLKLLNLNLVNNETFFNFSCYEAAQ